MKNTRKSIVILLAAAVILAAACFAAVYGAGATPGSAGDPVVTKSYVDKMVESLREEIQAGAEVPAVSGETGFIVVTVDAGKSLFGREGTMLILRGGAATIIDNVTKDGVSDLTSGTNLSGGTSITKNHLLLIPRDDGRGMRCERLCYVMVSGDYYIQ